MSNTIQKHVELTTAVSRVWQALTRYQEFGKWFGVTLDQPFVPGQVCRGSVTNPGYEHCTMKIAIQAIEPKQLFSFTWHPYALDPQRDYSQEPPTLVEFRIEEATQQGTLLSVTESGFDHIPDDRREEAFSANTRGWETQMQNIKQYLEKHS